MTPYSFTSSPLFALQRSKLGARNQKPPPFDVQELELAGSVYGHSDFINASSWDATRLWTTMTFEADIVAPGYPGVSGTCRRVEHLTSIYGWGNAITVTHEQTGSWASYMQEAGANVDYNDAAGTASHIEGTITTVDDIPMADFTVDLSDAVAIDEAWWNGWVAAAYAVPWELCSYERSAGSLWLCPTPTLLEDTPTHAKSAEIFSGHGRTFGSFFGEAYVDSGSRGCFYTMSLLSQSGAACSIFVQRCRFKTNGLRVCLEEAGTIGNTYLRPYSANVARNATVDLGQPDMNYPVLAWGDPPDEAARSQQWIRNGYLEGESCPVGCNS